MVVWGCARFVRVGQRTAVQSGTVPYSTRPGRGGVLVVYAVPVVCVRRYGR